MKCSLLWSQQHVKCYQHPAVQHDLVREGEARDRSKKSNKSRHLNVNWGMHVCVTCTRMLLVDVDENIVMFFHTQMLKSNVVIHCLWHICQCVFYFASQTQLK